MKLTGMKLGTNRGPKQVVFKTFEAGYDIEKSRMKQLGFEIGNVYNVKRVEVGGWSSDVFLEEFPNEGFNSVFFEAVDDIPPINVVDHAIWKLNQEANTTGDVITVKVSKEREKGDSLGDRMKEIEHRGRHFLCKKVPVIMRLDGKAFHTFTKGCNKPYDTNIITSMQDTTEYLLKNIQGAKVAYVQSDEISLLLTDYERPETEAWFNYNMSKMESVSAAMAAVEFTFRYTYIKEMGMAYPVNVRPAHFDSRARNYPKDEVINYFRWRYQDWLRNSIQMLAQSLYSHKELHGKKSPDLHEMCFQKGRNWNDELGECKNGTLFVRGADGVEKYTEFNLMNNEFCNKVFGEYV